MDPFSVVMSVMIALLAFIILVSFIFICLTCCEFGDNEHKKPNIYGSNQSEPVSSGKELMGEESGGRKSKSGSKYGGDEEVFYSSIDDGNKAEGGGYYNVGYKSETKTTIRSESSGSISVEL